MHILSFEDWMQIVHNINVKLIIDMPSHIWDKYLDQYNDYKRKHEALTK